MHNFRNVITCWTMWSVGFHVTLVRWINAKPKSKPGLLAPYATTAYCKGKSLMKASFETLGEMPGIYKNEFFPLFTLLRWAFSDIVFETIGMIFITLLNCRSSENLKQCTKNVQQWGSEMKGSLTNILGGKLLPAFYIKSMTVSILAYVS